MTKNRDSFSKVLLAPAVALFCSVAVLSLLAQKIDHKAIERELRRMYAGQVATLNAPFMDKRMRFDREGRWIHKKFALEPHPGQPFEIRDIRVKKNRYELRGNWVCGPGTNADGTVDYIRLPMKVRIDLATNPEDVSVADFNRLAGLVFGTKSPDTEAAALEPATKVPEEEEPPFYQVGGEVSLPRCIYCPEPEYTDEARHENLNGVVLLWAIIDIHGRAKDIRVVRSLGRGLDEAAVRSVRNYCMRPAMRKGKPVPVAMNIEVSFQLY